MTPDDLNVNALLYAAIFCRSEAEAREHGRWIGQRILAGDPGVLSSDTLEDLRRSLSPYASGDVEASAFPMVRCGEVKADIARAFLQAMARTVAGSPGS